jgi:hypothetical protein
MACPLLLMADGKTSVPRSTTAYWTWPQAPRPTNDYDTATARLIRFIASHLSVEKLVVI